ncbi:hypothetical protein NKJ88_11700 [Mesorhizobium sp. M0016]|uniref:zinc ribbon domain-containing protein n=1 Tax=Mesorhizobium sp. M0016 TaxID=2956843 RepID=UPI00333CBAC5
MFSTIILHVLASPFLPLTFVLLLVWGVYRLQRKFKRDERARIEALWRDQRNDIEPGSKSSGPVLEKKCPDCAEMVKADARICRFCRHEF